MQQHVRISKYELRRGTFDEVAEAARAGISRALEDRPGFVTHGVVDVGDRTLLSLTLWETRRHADAAMPAAETWVRENIAHRLGLRSTQSGELAFFEDFEGSPSTVEEPRATVQPALV